MVASALLGHWLSYTGCWQSLLVMYWLMFGMLFLFLTTSLGCFVHGLCFSINGLTKLPWTSYLQAMLRIISRSVSDWAGWRLGPWMNTCLLCMIVHFSANILKWELVCKFGVRFHIFINIYALVHGFMHETSAFLLYNNLFIYQVLCRVIYRRRSLYSFLWINFNPNMDE